MDDMGAIAGKNGMQPSQLEERPGESAGCSLMAGLGRIDIYKFGVIVEEARLKTQRGHKME